MAYAAYGDVIARAGRFAGVFALAGKRPNQTDVEGFLQDVAAQLDSSLRARGYDPATVGASVRDALRDLSAFGALSIGLGGQTGDEINDVRRHANSIWSRGLAAIADGSLPAIRELESGRAGGRGAGAGSFWSHEPDYGTAAAAAAEAERLRGTNLAPAFERGQSL